MTSAAAASSAASPAAERWFGDAFARLHPRLQALHREGGRLSGPVAFEVGRGIAGLLGRLALRRLGVDPAKRTHTLIVEISHVEISHVDISHVADGLRWSRRFDDGPETVSLFRPVGHWPDGHWCESSGPLVLELGVDPVEGGWRWRQRACRWWGMTVPGWLAPRVEAGKTVDGDAYRFDVAIVLPLIGRVLAWAGTLRMAS
jgi:hypothetical protein